MRFFDFFKGRKPLFQQPDTALYEEECVLEEIDFPIPHYLDGICWGGGVRGKALDHQAATKNFCFVGTVGSGKTVSIKLLLQTVLPFITYEEFDHRALVYDPKQEMLPFLLGLNQYIEELDRQDAEADDREPHEIKPIEIKTLNPFDVNGYAWDMASDITERAHAQEMSTILIPMEPNAHQPFFGDAARHLLEGVITSFMLSAGKRWTFRDVMYAMGTKDRIIEVLNLHEETRELIPLYFDHEETAKNIMSTVATKLKSFKIIAGLWDRARKKVGTVSLKDWLESRQKKNEQNYILVLGNDETARTAIDAINQVIFKRVSQMILNQPDLDYVVDSEEIACKEVDQRRHWIILDEVRNAGRLDGLQALMTKGRSKGAAVVLSFQDIDGLRSVYGKDEANEMTGQCSSYAVFRLQSPETAEWAARVFGSGELKEEYTDKSSGKSVTEGSNWQSGPGGNSSGGSYAESYNWGESKRLVYRESKVVYPSQFTYLPPAGFEEGLSGWYLSPYVKKPYGLNISGDALFGSGGWLAKSAEYEMKRRSRRAQKLCPWSNEERARLGLNEALLAVPEMKIKDEQRRQVVQQVKGLFREVEIIAREFAELVFYRGDTLSAEELEELREVHPMAEGLYARLLAKMKKDAGDVPDIEIELTEE
ncbi:MAG: type IV secretory system conjugative DNA transfer family protein [Oligoflexales bacterium]|nr:type IV secretion system DNA-binding domain-containing protein [Nitrosomonas nitrosa]